MGLWRLFGMVQSNAAVTCDLRLGYGQTSIARSLDGPHDVALAEPGI